MERKNDDAPAWSGDPNYLPPSTSWFELNSGTKPGCPFAQLETETRFQTKNRFSKFEGFFLFCVLVVCRQTQQCSVTECCVDLKWALPTTNDTEKGIWIEREVIKGRFLTIFNNDLLVLFVLLQLITLLLSKLGSPSLPSFTENGDVSTRLLINFHIIILLVLFRKTFFHDCDFHLNLRKDFRQKWWTWFTGTDAFA